MRWIGKLPAIAAVLYNATVFAEADIDAAREAATKAVVASYSAMLTEAQRDMRLLQGGRVDKSAARDWSRSGDRFVFRTDEAKRRLREAHAGTVRALGKLVEEARRAKAMPCVSIAAAEVGAVGVLDQGGVEVVEYSSAAMKINTYRTKPTPVTVLDVGESRWVVSAPRAVLRERKLLQPTKVTHVAVTALVDGPPPSWAKVGERVPASAVFEVVGRENGESGRLVLKLKE